MPWIIKNAYLTMEEMQNNAQLVFAYFWNRGWTLNAIAGMLGNMESESTINPGIWEGLIAGNLDGGYGLTQWTPATKYIDWAGADYENGDKECSRIQWERDNEQQWGIEPEYPITFKQFSTSTESPEYLAYAFLYNYEKPGDWNQPNRQTQARYWFDYLGGGIPCKIDEVITLEKSRIGKNQYTQDPVLREDVFGEPTGYSDCSSLQWKCYEVGGDIYIGSWTGEQLEHGWNIWTNPGDGHIFTKEFQAESGAVKGDLVFWGPGNTADSHVEMFLGDDQFIGHGSGWGPTIKTASTYDHPQKLNQVRRYMNCTPVPPDPGGEGGTLPIWMYLRLF